MKSRFKNVADIEKYIFERFGAKVIIEKRRNYLHMYYVEENGVNSQEMYCPAVFNLTEAGLKELVKPLEGIPYYE